MTSTNPNYGTNKAVTRLEGKTASIVVAKSFVTPSEPRVECMGRPCTLVLSPPSLFHSAFTLSLSFTLALTHSLTHSLTHDHSLTQSLTNSPSLPSSLPPSPDGSVLCAVGYEDGQVWVYSLSLSLSWGSEFMLSSILATGIPRTSAYPGTHTHT